MASDNKRFKNRRTQSFEIFKKSKLENEGPEFECKLPLAQVVIAVLGVTKVSLSSSSPLAQVVIAALGAIKVFLFIVFPPLPRW